MFLHPPGSAFTRDGAAWRVWEQEAPSGHRPETEYA